MNLCVLTVLSMMLGGCVISTAQNGSFNVSEGKESDATVKKEVAIEEFNSVSVSQGIKVIFTQGQNSGKASVATTPEAESYLRISVEDKTLSVRYETPNMKNVKIKGPSIVRVSSPKLSQVSASSGADFKLDGAYTDNGDLDVSMSSSAEFEGTSVVCANLVVNLSSSGEFNLDTYTGNLNLKLSSGAEFELDKLNGDVNVSSSSGADCEIKKITGKSIMSQASSGGDIKLKSVAVESVNAQASSGADITIEGQTGSLNKSASSGGSVNVTKLSVAK